MSDKPLTATEAVLEAAKAEFEDRSPEEMKALESTFMAPRGAVPYVAQPAPGYDVDGVWATFGAQHRSGYAAHAISLQWALMQCGVRTQLIPHRTNDIDIDDLPADRNEMLLGWIKEAVGRPHAIFSSYPPDISALMDGLGPKLVPYCAFEGTKISPMMVAICNGRAFEQIWVVSDFVARVFQDSGITKNIRVVPPVLFGGPWPIGADDIALARASRDRPVTTEDPFVFGTLGTWQERKGMLALVRAYFSAFKRTDPVTLRIHTSVFGENLTIRSFKEKVIAQIAKIAAEFGDVNYPASHKMPHIRLDLGTDDTDRQLIEWLAQLDCYANPSFGEGLGIPHVWSKGLGLPMVSTMYGAVGDLLVATQLDCDEIVPHTCTPVSQDVLRANVMFAKDSLWGTYDPLAFGTAMRAVFTRGRVFDTRASDHVVTHFGAAHATNEVKQGLESLLSSEALSLVTSAG